MKYLFALFLAHFALVGCGSSSGSSSENKSENTVLIQGKAPLEYYTQLFTDCPNNKTSCVFATHDSILKKKYEDGKDASIEFDLFLLKDGNYVFNYYEAKIAYYTLSGHASNNIFKKQYSGHWSLSEDGKLILSGMGVARSLIYNNRPAMILVIEKDLNLSGLAGNELITEMVRSSVKNFDLSNL